VTAIMALEGIDGAGKTSLVTRLAAALAELGLDASMTRLSPRMGAVFRELVDEPSGGEVRYQDVLPGDFRRAAYLVDAVAQFRYLAGQYARHDWLLFDRWLPTYDAYCAGVGRHEHWYRELAGTLPVPEVYCYLRVSPEVAAERVRQRGDWTAERWSASRLLADLRRLAASYDELMAAIPGVIVLDGDQDADAVYTTALGMIIGRSA
jgi:dTMP kinase